MTGMQSRMKSMQSGIKNMQSCIRGMQCAYAHEGHVCADESG